MKPINYYIQLSDEASTYVDSLDKRSLIALSRQALDCELKGDKPTLFPINGWHIYETFTATQLITLAYGLLAKANCMK